jgi:hypothetical protein
MFGATSWAAEMVLLKRLHVLVFVEHGTPGLSPR